MCQSGASAKKNLNIVIGRAMLKPKLVAGETITKMKTYLVLIARMQMKVVSLNKNLTIVLD